MDIIRVEDRHVIKCVHCNGTGTCHRPGYLEVQRKVGEVTQVGAILVCPKCGEGVFRPASRRGFWGRLYLPSSNEMVWPVCGVCGGKGHTVVA